MTLPMVTGLVSLLKSPPPLLIGLLAVAAGWAAVAILRRLRTADGAITLDEQREMLEIAGIATAVATATLALLSLGMFSLLVTIVLGFAGGYGAVRLAQSRLTQQALGLEDRRLRITLGWFAVSITASTVLPTLHGPSLHILGTQAVLAIGGTGMVVYNAQRVRH